MFPPRWWMRHVTEAFEKSSPDQGLQIPPWKPSGGFPTPRGGSHRNVFRPWYGPCGLAPHQSVQSPSRKPLRAWRASPPPLPHGGVQTRPVQIGTAPRRLDAPCTTPTALPCHHPRLSPVRVRSAPYLSSTGPLSHSRHLRTLTRCRARWQRLTLTVGETHIHALYACPSRPYCTAHRAPGSRWPTSAGATLACVVVHLVRTLA